MATTELMTRIALKYDSYENWTNEGLGANKGANLVLLKGELGICEVPAANADSNVAPTVIFKVGGAKYTAEDAAAGKGTEGELMKFKDLPWASAKAADVYSWAKKSETEFKTWLDQTAGFATDAEVEALVATERARIAALEAKFNAADGTSVQDQINGLDERLDIIEGNGEGSVKKALADAKAYTDEEIKEAIGVKAEGEAAATGIRGEIAEAEAAAKAYTDTAVTNQGTIDAAQDLEIEKKLDKTTYEAYIAGKSMSDEDLKKYAEDEADAAESAAIAAAKTETEEQIKAFKDGDFSDLNTRVAGIDAAYKAADEALDGRLGTVEAKLADVANVMDFVGTREVSIDDETNAITVTPVGDETFNKGDVIVDGTGKEYVYDGEAWYEFGYADSNAAAISDLQGRMTIAEEDIDELETAVAAKLASEDFNTWKQNHENDHANKQTAITKAINDEKSAREEADNAINNKIGTLPTGDGAYTTLVAGIADAKQAGINADAKAASAVGRLDVIEPKVTTLQDIVSGYSDKGAIKTAIEAAASAASVADNKAVAADEKAVDAQTRVGVLENTTVPAVKAIAEDAQTRVAAIEADYVKATDLVNDYYIFNCGSSTTIVHENTAN